MPDIVRKGKAYLLGELNSRLACPCSSHEVTSLVRSMPSTSSMPLSVPAVDAVNISLNLVQLTLQAVAIYKLCKIESLMAQNHEATMMAFGKVQETLSRNHDETTGLLAHNHDETKGMLALNHAQTIESLSSLHKSVAEVDTLVQDVRSAVEITSRQIKAQNILALKKLQGDIVDPWDKLDMSGKATVTHTSKPISASGSVPCIATSRGRATEKSPRKHGVGSCVDDGTALWNRRKGPARVDQAGRNGAAESLMKMPPQRPFKRLERYLYGTAYDQDQLPRLGPLVDQGTRWPAMRQAMPAMRRANSNISAEETEILTAKPLVPGSRWNRVTMSIEYCRLPLLLEGLRRRFEWRAGHRRARVGALQRPSLPPPTTTETTRCYYGGALTTL